MMLQKIKILIFVLVCTLNATPVFGEDCTDFNPMLATDATLFNNDVNYALGSILLSNGDLKIVKTKTFAEQVPDGGKTVIVGTGITGIDFRGFLTLSVLTASYECRSLVIQTTGESLIVDKDTVHDLLNAAYPMHRDNRFKIDTVGGKYEITGRFKEVTIWGQTVKLSGACLKKCEPIVDCRADFTFKETNGVVEFFNTSSLNPAIADSYVWDFADGNTSGEENTVHDFPSGTHTVCLLVEKAGCIVPKMEACHEINSFPKPACEVSFAYEIENTTVNFKNTSTLRADEADHFTWYFGDEAESDENDPIHTYALGTYKVCIEVASENCAQDSVMDACENLAITGCQIGHVTMTPDGDGNADDVFMQAGSSVYDRNGYLVIEIQEDVNWTGVGASNEELPLGYYTIICKEGGTYHVTIIR